mgnify:CR=1 FL=1
MYNLIEIKVRIQDKKKKVLITIYFVDGNGNPTSDCGIGTYPMQHREKNYNRSNKNISLFRLLLLGNIVWALWKTH